MTVSFKLFARVVGFTLLLSCAFTSFGQTLPSKPQRYAFELPEKQAHHLLDCLSEVQLGDKLLRVKSLLGRPDVERDIVDKSGVFKSHIIKYYFAKVDLNLENNNDRVLSLYFDRRGSLIEISRPPH